MKAYHIRTREPDRGLISKCTGLGATFDLDAIYIPEMRVLLGIGYYEGQLGKGKKRNEAFVMNYSNQKYIERADCIVNGNRDGVEGSVVSEIPLSDQQASGIAESRKYANKTVKTKKPFDMSTESIVGILSGEEISSPGLMHNFFSFLKKTA